MSNKEIIIWSVFLLAHLIFSVYVLKNKIINNKLLSLKEKRIHSILILAIPFLWYLLVKGNLNYKFEPMTKSGRKQLRKRKGVNFNKGGLGNAIHMDDNKNF